MHKQHEDRVDHVEKTKTTCRFKVKLTHQEYQKLRGANMRGKFPHLFERDVETGEVFITTRVHRLSKGDAESLVMQDLISAMAGARNLSFKAIEEVKK